MIEKNCLLTFNNMCEACLETIVLFPSCRINLSDMKIRFWPFRDFQLQWSSSNADFEWSDGWSVLGRISMLVEMSSGLFV